MKWSERLEEFIWEWRAGLIATAAGICVLVAGFLLLKEEENRSTPAPQHAAVAAAAAKSPTNCFRLKDEEGQNGTLYTTHFVPYCGESAAEIAHVRAALPTNCPKSERMVYSMDIETGQGEDALCEVARQPLVAELYRSSERHAISGIILLNKP